MEVPNNYPSLRGENRFIGIILSPELYLMMVLCLHISYWENNPNNQKSGASVCMIWKWCCIFDEARRSRETENISGYWIEVTACQRCTLMKDWQCVELENHTDSLVILKRFFSFQESFDGPLFSTVVYFINTITPGSTVMGCWIEHAKSLLRKH